MKFDYLRKSFVKFDVSVLPVNKFVQFTEFSAYVLSKCDHNETESDRKTDDTNDVYSHKIAWNNFQNKHDQIR